MSGSQTETSSRSWVNHPTELIIHPELWTTLDPRGWMWTETRAWVVTPMTPCCTAINKNLLIIFPWILPKSHLLISISHNGIHFKPGVYLLLMLGRTCPERNGSSYKTQAHLKNLWKSSSFSCDLIQNVDLSDILDSLHMKLNMSSLFLFVLISMVTADS